MGVISGGNVITGAIGRGGAPSSEGAGFGGLRTARGDYSFAADGGAIGTIPLMGATGIPSGSIVVGGLIEVVTPPASGGAATIAVQIEGAGDVLAAAAVSGAPWSTAGRKSVIPAFTGATSLKTTAARDISAVIAVAALNAGAFTIYIFYIPPSD